MSGTQGIPGPNIYSLKKYNTFLKPSFVFEWRILAMVLILAIIPSVQCGKKPGHDKTPYILQKKLGLNNEQSKQVEKFIQEIKDLREREREQYAGDLESLLKAAKARRSLEQERIESLLDENQKAKFRKIMAEWNVTDHTLVISDRLGLDGPTTRRINKIVVRAPTEEEVIAAKKSGDPEKLKAVRERADKIHAEIESFLTDEQKKEFRKMVQERMARIDQMTKNN
jgi:hypothetical protein